MNGVELQDVHGPSALSGGWRRMWELCLLISVTDFKRNYFGTALGYLWSLMRPLLLFVVLLEVFTHVLRIGSGTIRHYPVLLLFNIVFFGFFQEATVTAVGSVVGYEGIVRKTQFPRLAIPVSVVLTALYNLLLNLVVVIVFLFVYGVTPTWTWILLPVLLLLMAVFALGASMFLSSLYPRFRDIGIIWTVFVTALFYATPVLFTLDLARSHSRALARLIALNPLTPVFELARRWIIDPTAPLPGSAATGGLGPFLVSVALFVAICALGVWTFRREAPRIAEQL
ncbi:MAG TPA: ABC transporter permease [Solirubrobacteraceae bacterium]|nr:ABC transporter permease [Solirubrobacteraceae bacterium]